MGSRPPVGFKPVVWPGPFPSLTRTANLDRRLQHRSLDIAAVRNPSSLETASDLQLSHNPLLRPTGSSSSVSGGGTQLRTGQMGIAASFGR